MIPLPFLNLAISIVRVSPDNAAGTVQLKDATTNLGNPEQVSGGVVIFIQMLGNGRHALTAMFTPTDPAAFGPSTSNTVTVRFGQG